MLPLFSNHDAPLSIAEDYESSASLVLYQGDAQDYVRALPDQLVSLIVTSPPYNLGKSYETRVSIEQYLAAQADTIAELVRILKDDGSICWQV